MKKISKGGIINNRSSRSGFFSWANCQGCHDTIDQQHNLNLNLKKILVERINYE